MKLAILARGLASQFEIIHAVIMRETRTRFGAHSLGYLWAMLEPILMILTFFILFRMAKRQPPDGMDLIGFVGTGIIPYTLFMNSVTRVADAINANKGLLFYPHVQPIDLAYARCILEYITYVAVFILLMGTNALFQQKLDIADPMLILFGLGLASLLGSTFGLILCSASLLSNFVERARGPLLRPMFWISGIFFAANQLPEPAREVLLHNPLLHCIEFVRDGWYPSYHAEYASGTYVVLFIVGFAAIGLTFERNVRSRIEVG